MACVDASADQTLSRIPNWHEMAPVEQERTMRLIAKRNKQRTDALEAHAREQQQQPQQQQ